MKVLMKGSRAVGDIALKKLPVPVPGVGQVLVKVAYAGICGSDIDIIHSRNTIYKPPVVQGHEFSAIVVKVGESVIGFQPGDKVVSETTYDKCGKCKPCTDGNYHLCENKDILGWTVNGGFAEYVLLNSFYMHKLSNVADLQGAALIEPMAIASEGVHVKGQLQRDETVAVIGAGATGILSAVVAMEMGAKNVFFIGRKSSMETRFPIARELGIIHCIDSSSVNTVEYIKENNNGFHVDLVVDCSGNMAGFKTALELVKRNGRIIEIGSIHTDEPFPWPEAAFKAIDLKVVFSSSHEAWIKAVSIFNQSKVEFRKIISHIYSLDNYEESFQIAQDSKQSFKVIFKPND